MISDINRLSYNPYGLSVCHIFMWTDFFLWISTREIHRCRLSVLLKSFFSLSLSCSMCTYTIVVIHLSNDLFFLCISTENFCFEVLTHIRYYVFFSSLVSNSHDKNSIHINSSY